MTGVLRRRQSRDRLVIAQRLIAEATHPSRAGHVPSVVAREQVARHAREAAWHLRVAEDLLRDPVEPTEPVGTARNGGRGKYFDPLTRIRGGFRRGRAGLTVVAGGALLLALAGCGAGSGDAPAPASTVAPTYDGEGLSEAHVPLSDGRTVTCVVYAGYKRGGLSCDWQRARP